MAKVDSLNQEARTLPTIMEEYHVRAIAETIEITALLARAWLNSETTEFETLSESKVNSTSVSSTDSGQSMATTPAQLDRIITT